MDQSPELETDVLFGSWVLQWYNKPNLPPKGQHKIVIGDGRQTPKFAVSFLREEATIDKRCREFLIVKGTMGCRSVKSTDKTDRHICIGKCRSTQFEAVCIQFKYSPFFSSSGFSCFFFPFFSLRFPALLLSSSPSPTPLPLPSSSFSPHTPPRPRPLPSNPIVSFLGKIRFLPLLILVSWLRWISFSFLPT